MKSPLTPQARELLADTGHNLRVLRQAKGWRVEDLAKESGLSEKSIKNIETGKDFSFSSLIALVSALNDGAGQPVLSLVPKVTAANLVDEFKFSSVVSSKVKRVRVKKQGENT